MKGKITSLFKIQGKTAAGDYLEIKFRLEQTHRGSKEITTRYYVYSGIALHELMVDPLNKYEIEIAEHIKNGELDYIELEKLTELKIGQTAFDFSS